MPRYYFACECGEEKAVIRSSSQQSDPLDCSKCSKQMKRAPRGASSRIVETLDNGIMSRRVERPADVERRNWERSQKKEDREP